MFVGINKTKNNWYPEKPFMPIMPAAPLGQLLMSFP